MSWNSPFAVLTLAPFAVAVVVLIMAALGQFGAKKQAKWLKSHMTIATIIEQADQGLTPWLVNGRYVFMFTRISGGFYELINPTSGYAFMVGDDEQVAALLKKWGYLTSWGARARGAKHSRKGKVTEADPHRVY